MNYFIKEYVSLFLENDKSFKDVYKSFFVQEPDQEPVQEPVQEPDQEPNQNPNAKEKKEKMPEDPYYYLRPGYKQN